MFMTGFQPKTIYFEKKEAVFFEKEWILGVTFRVLALPTQHHNGFLLQIAISKNKPNNHYSVKRYLTYLQKQIFDQFGFHLSLLADQMTLQNYFNGTRNLCFKSRRAKVPPKIGVWIIENMPRINQILVKRG